MSNEYNFYQLESTKSASVDPSRVYPYSHTYATNIGLLISPLKRHFLSIGKGKAIGVADKDITLQQYFGTDSPEVRPLNFLTLNNEILGIRFAPVPDNSAFTFDVAVESLSDVVLNGLQGLIPSEEMVLDGRGNYTTRLESESNIYVCDVSECTNITDFLNVVFART